VEIRVVDWSKGGAITLFAERDVKTADFENSVLSRHNQFDSTDKYLIR
jgi:hypothetical protein